MGNLRLALAPFLENKEGLAEAIVTVVVLGFVLLVGPYYVLFGRGRGRERSKCDALRVERVRPEARLPEAPSARSLGYTLHSAEGGVIAPGSHAGVRTGLRIGVPEGHVGLVVTVRPVGGFAHLQVLPSLLHPDSLEEVALTVTNCNATTEAVIEVGDPIAHLTLLCAARPPLHVTTFDVSRSRFTLVKRLTRMVWVLLKRRLHEMWLWALARSKVMATVVAIVAKATVMPLDTEDDPPGPTTTLSSVEEEYEEDKEEAALESNEAREVASPASPTSPVSSTNGGPVVTSDDWTPSLNTPSSDQESSPEAWRRRGRRRRNASTVAEISATSATPTDDAVESSSAS